MWEAASVVWSLILWGYVLIGIVVAILTSILTSKYSQGQGTSWAMAAGAWYLGAPIAVFALGWLLGLNDKWVEHQYQFLCKEKSIDSISSVSANIGAIKLDGGGLNGKNARSVLAAFGGSHKLFGFRDHPGPFHDADETSFTGSFIILKVRSIDHIPYMGTFYATEIDLEILDSQTQSLVARRRTFTRGQAGHAASGDCDGEQLHESNLNFVLRAIPRAP